MKQRLREGIDSEALENHELRSYGQRVFEWQNQRQQLRRWAAEANDAGDAALITKIQRAIADHNEGKPTGDDKAEAKRAYKRRVATYFEPAPSRAEELAYRRFQEIDRLMRQRRAVVVA